MKQPGFILQEEIQILMAEKLSLTQRFQQGKVSGKGGIEQYSQYCDQCRNLDLQLIAQYAEILASVGETFRESVIYTILQQFSCVQRQDKPHLYDGYSPNISGYEGEEQILQAMSQHKFQYCESCSNGFRSVFKHPKFGLILTWVEGDVIFEIYDGHTDFEDAYQKALKFYEYERG